MPLSAEDQAFRKQIFTNLKLEESLKPGDPRYEHVYDRPGCEDPAGRIRDQIELSGEESTIFLSGFRGSGKTTELLRLKHELEPDYVVIYADAIDYLNPSQPIEISSLLIFLAGAFDDAARAEGIKLAGDSYWTRVSATGDLALQEKEIERARALFEEALDLYRIAGDPYSVGLALRRLARMEEDKDKRGELLAATVSRWTAIHREDLVDALRREFPGEI